jgi:DNA-binding response OmpR family regulator
VDDKTVDAHISNIRKAVLKASGEKMIETVRSNGFIVSLRKT